MNRLHKLAQEHLPNINLVIQAPPSTGGPQCRNTAVQKYDKTGNICAKIVENVQKCG